MIEQKNITEGSKAVLVGLILPNELDATVNDHLDELAFLALTAGFITAKTIKQRLRTPDVKYFLGKGKMEELLDYVKKKKVDAVIFDDDLSPSQMRNIEKKLQVQIYDRSLLILEIFHLRAKTSQARTQVELARYEYLLPRLTRMWTHLERQRGGTGTRGGAGEKEIETDRRIIRSKISLLKKKLVTIDKQMATQRKNRGGMIRVALIGYTNVGKSTIMNALGKAEVFAENKLFATLDTTVRKVVLERLPFLLSDTVGFIRKLPHSLVESFKSTLDEVREADLLLHVVDVSHPNFEDHLNVVKQTLKELDAGNIPTLMVFNKMDLYKTADEDEFDLTGDKRFPVSLNELKKTWMFNGNDAIFISAKKKQNMDEFRTLLHKKVEELTIKRYPYKAKAY